MCLDEQFGQVNFSFSLLIENHLEMDCSNGDAISDLPKTEGGPADSVRNPGEEKDPLVPVISFMYLVLQLLG